MVCDSEADLAKQLTRGDRAVIVAEYPFDDCGFIRCVPAVQGGDYGVKAHRIKPAWDRET